MNVKILQMIQNEIESNKKVALLTLTGIEGSTPRNEGSMMVVLENGDTYETIGGGKLEIVAIDKAKECLKKGISRKYTFDLTDNEGSLGMQCGGQVEVFVKVFKPDNKLLIVGGGHIALQLYKFGKLLNFHTVIFEDRKEYCNLNRFPDADELILGDIKEKLIDYPISKDCYIVIITRGHRLDEVALKSVLNRGASYVGMIGSKNKTRHVMNNLRNEGYKEEVLDTVYAPIGLRLGGEEPSEIALSIISEIVMVKNNGRLKHMRD